MHHKDVVGGIFAIVWAAVAAPHGLLTVLNWRGYTERLLRFAERWHLTDGRMSLGLARVLGGVFLAASPFVLILGILVG